MNNLVHNFLQHYLNNNQDVATQQQQNYNNNNGNLLGSSPMDWLTSAATFGGADLLLNKIDDEEHKQHFWRNAGIAGALALGYQYYRNHHHNNNQMLYQYPYSNSYPQQLQQQYYYYPQEQQQQQQQQYYPPYHLQQQQNPYSYMMQPQYTGYPAFNNIIQPSMLNNYQAMGPNPMIPFFPQHHYQQMIPYGTHPHYNRMF